MDVRGAYLPLQKYCGQNTNGCPEEQLVVPVENFVDLFSMWEVEVQVSGGWWVVLNIKYLGELIRKGRIASSGKRGNNWKETSTRGPHCFQSIYINREVALGIRSLIHGCTSTPHLPKQTRAAAISSP